jgi:DNA-binding NarL/FixJ family response regulator
VGTKMTQVAIVEDHPLFRKSLAQVIRAAADLMLVGMAASLEEFASCGRSAATVVVLDLQLPGLGGPGAVAHLSKEGHAVLVLSASEVPADMVQAMRAGARGYLSKQADEAEILRAIRTVAHGETYVAPTLASHLLEAPLRITAREQEILELVADGETDQDIAELLGISIRTVHSHLDRIRDKTGSRRRAELTRLAIERGIVTDPHREG